MVFKFVDGDYKGQKVYSYQGLDNPTGISIALAILEKLGYEVTSPDEIDAADRKLSKEQPEVELRLQTRGDFQNKIVVAKLDDSDDSEEDEDDADVEEADEDDEETVAPAKKVNGKKSDVETDEDEDDASDTDSEEAEETDDEADEDEDGEDDDEDEEKPVAKTKKVADKKAKKIVEEEDEDEETDDEADEDEDADSEEEEVALEPGMKLKVKHDGETVKVKIIKVDEKAKEVRVKLADGSKITISVDDIVDVIS